LLIGISDNSFLGGMLVVRDHVLTVPARKTATSNYLLISLLSVNGGKTQE
jgi:hypothetical protein